MFIPGRACRPSRLEFSVVFTETRVNTGLNPFIFLLLHINVGVFGYYSQTHVFVYGGKTCVEKFEIIFQTLKGRKHLFPQLHQIKALLETFTNNTSCTIYKDV